MNDETTGEHIKAKLEDNPYAGVTGAQASESAAYATSQLSQHTGSTVPGVPQNQYLRDMSKLPDPAPRIFYIPILGWPVTRGPVKTYEWYLGASIIIVIMMLFVFVRIFYIG